MLLRHRKIFKRVIPSLGIAELSLRRRLHLAFDANRIATHAAFDSLLSIASIESNLVFLLVFGGTRGLTFQTVDQFVDKRRV